MFRVQGTGYSVSGLEFRVQGSGFRPSVKNSSMYTAGATATNTPAKRFWNTEYRI